MRTWIAIGLLLGGAGLASAQRASEHELLVRKLLGEFAQRGYAIDGEALRVEVRDPRACEEDVDRQQDLFFRPAHFSGEAGLVSALIDEDLRLSDAQARLTAVQASLHAVPAYYQWDRDALVFPRTALGEAVETMGNREGVVAHELAHALQDQRPGGIEARVQPKERWTDAVNVARCLLEGEAELIALEVLRARKELDLSGLTEEQLERAASLEQRLTGSGSMIYHVGRSVLLRDWKRGGWDAVRARIQSPPPSSEQLLHPNKLGLDTPTEVLPQELEGWTPLFRDVVGELQTFVYLSRLGAPDSAVAACGWDGDCLQVFRNDQRQKLVVWRTVWDSELDAKQFHQALPAKGRAVRHGRWVDLVWSNAPGAAFRVRGKLSAPPEAAPQEADAASTREAERALALRAARDEPRLEGNRWAIPGARLVLRLPEGWTTRHDGAIYAGVSPDVRTRGFRDNVNVQLQPNPLGEDLDAHAKFNREQLAVEPGMTLVSLEKSQAAGRPLLKARFTGTMNLNKLEFECWIFPRQQDQVVITTTTLVSHPAEVKASLRRILESIEFTE